MEKLRNVARFGKYGKRLCMMFLFLCITTSGLMRASVFAQTTVTAKFRNVTLNEVLWEIQKQTDFTFIYSTNDAKKVRVENLDVKNGGGQFELYIAGGGAKNALLNELTAQYTGKEVVALPIEATALGNLKIQREIR